jgi:8-oxo-dGTP pyrophosphatase MutT (NUDIX family)
MIDTYTIPVSIKGVIFQDQKVWLRFNQRNEWELPGGKMDEGEQPEETCVREIQEELGLLIKPVEIIQAHLYTIDISKDESKGVLVVSYLCDVIKRVGNVEKEWEEGIAKFKLFSIKEIKNLTMPDFYKEAIKKAWDS